MTTLFFFLRHLHEEGSQSVRVNDFEAALLSFNLALSVARQYNLHKNVTNDILVSRSMTYAGLGQWDSSLEDAEKVLLFNPNHMRAMKRKTKALLALKRDEEAVRLLRRRIQKFPDQIAYFRKQLSKAERSIEASGNLNDEAESQCRPYRILI